MACTVTVTRKLVYVGHRWFHSTPPNLYGWPTYGHQVALRKMNQVLSFAQEYTSECRDKWSNWKTSTQFCLWTGTFIKVLEQMLPRNSKSVAHTCGEKMEV